MITPGLARTARLLERTPLPWKAIHVAGTNGKGSVCAYASAMLRAGRVHSGRFTSPHLIDRWDCITINENVVNESSFRQVEEEIKYRNSTEDIQASEFELLTATAFTMFTREKVDLAVIEVGMGGREDATNIIRDPLATVITNISKDHQAFLGDTIEEIAEHKAGIMKPGAPCFVDGTNIAEVLRVIQQEATRIAAEVVMIPQERQEQQQHIWDRLSIADFEPHQRINVSLAFAAVTAALRTTHTAREVSKLASAVRETVWPGRLQYVSMKGFTGRQEPILLDGAHNAASAQVLGSYVDRKIRQRDPAVTWVIAVSKGKNLPELLSYLIKPMDSVVATEFGPVDGMPWVQPAESTTILFAASGLGVSEQRLSRAASALEATRISAESSKGRPVIMAGSLYLVSDVLRLLKESPTENCDTVERIDA